MGGSQAAVGMGQRGLHQRVEYLRIQPEGRAAVELDKFIGDGERFLADGTPQTQQSLAQVCARIAFRSLGP